VSGVPCASRRKSYIGASASWKDETVRAPGKEIRLERRGRCGLREVRLVVLDARSEEVRRRIADAVARLDPEDERDAMRWIEAVSAFDADHR